MGYEQHIEAPGVPFSVDVQHENVVGQFLHLSRCQFLLLHVDRCPEPQEFASACCAHVVLLYSSCLCAERRVVQTDGAHLCESAQVAFHVIGGKLAYRARCVAHTPRPSLTPYGSTSKK